MLTWCNISNRYLDTILSRCSKHITRLMHGPEQLRNVLEFCQMSLVVMFYLEIGSAFIAPIVGKIWAGIK